VKDHASKQLVVKTETIVFKEKDKSTEETLFLKKVTSSLDLLTSIANAKTAVDEFEQLSESARGMLLDYATPSALRHKTYISREAGEVEKWSDEFELLMQMIGEELAQAEITIADFNNWELDIPALSYLQRMALAQCLLVMYDNAPGFKDGKPKVSKFVTHDEVVKALERVYDDEQAVPFTNWNHAVDVAHTLNQFFRLLSAENYFAKHERFAMMLAALAHDVGHFGATNSFLREASHPVALVYNDISCTEMMSCAKLFEILKKPGTDLLITFDQARRREIREVIVQTILHTDMARHSNIMAQMLDYYEAKRELFDFIEKPSPLQTQEQKEQAQSELEDYFWNADVKNCLRVWLVHLADISQPFKPWDLCHYWAQMQFDEFYKQGDLERERKIGMSPLNDRVRTNMARAQISFIKFFVIPATTLTVKMLQPLGVCETYLWPNLEQWVEEWRKTKPDVDDFNKMAQDLQELQSTAHHKPGIEVHTMKQKRH